MKALELENELESPTTKIEANLKGIIYKLLNLLGKLIAFVIKLIPGFILYAFVAWIYLSIYSASDFETTLILLLVGVIVFALRKN